MTWFLLGGDLYTAYTFVAVPAAMWATGAVSGFFAVPYTIVLYPIVFLLMSRLWSVSHRHGFVTPADFVGGRYGSRALTLAVAVTGIVATMPYIALQLVGIKAVLTVLGLGSAENVLLTDLPLIIAFVVLAAYTYTSGLRAPALIAVVKDLLIYLAVIVAVIYLPIKFGGWGTIFDSAETKLAATNPATGKPVGVVHPWRGQLLRLLDPGPGLGLGAVHVPALDHRRPGHQEQEHDPQECGGTAAVLADAGVPGAAGLRGHLCRHRSPST